MREVKFRAWNKQINRWTSNVLVDLTSPVVSSYIELMQYTGLKDKNGKEIYEGDIVEGVGIKAVCVYTILKKQGVQIGAGFMFEAIGTDQALEHFVLKDKEVVGNIYENPEFING